MPHLEKALELSKQVNNNERLLSSAYYNIGKNYGDLEEYSKAEIYLKKAAEISEKYKLGNLPHSLFTYAKLLFKQGKTSEAIQISKKGLSSAIYQGDKLFESLQKYLEALYINAIDQLGIKKTIDYLEKNKNYSYVEDIALDTAAVYAESKQYDKSYFYHQKMIQTQKQIQRGECLYEF